ncbi:hypothetical protein CP97_12965 [Aurantiacibacter atlanticus]|uniref:Uncharacterized protein n=1 Tax=Aurantiacibacter atlanticus TaxID=1648404 RepID=A0A0H4VIJ8_9SPHN|nr:hypothetical protein [Aurantiacibacter atlanticus]AKQ42754.1 hypothetical protein CP97_12965 [Aurantiacibacter atlanticus]MDF1835380.1 hypothetical protein [Alteraurantiacibacter sp. bin_em_oilr2.035]
MLTASKRAACQRYFEEKFGVSSPEDLAIFRDELRAHRITLADEQALRDHSDSDALASYERAALSLLQAVCDLQKGDRLWAAVKLYYSVFYSLKTEILLERYTPIRAGRVLIFDCKQGEFCKQYNGRSSGDHGLAIALAKRYFSESDVLQSQSIDGIMTYEWLKSVREVVQYRLRRPPELEKFDPFFSDEQWDLGNQIETFLADTEPYYAFDADYAALAIPVKRFQLTSQRLMNENMNLDSEFRSYLDRYFEAGSLSNRFQALLPS